MPGPVGSVDPGAVQLALQRTQQPFDAGVALAQLLAKNEQARSRVEAMIARLKSLEQHT